MAPLRTIISATAGGTLLATTVIALIGYFMAQRISRPLERSLRVMERLSRGDVGIEIDEGNGILETRQISAALKTFQGNMLETQRLMGEIKASQDEMTSLLDSSPIGAVVLAENGQVLFVNEPGALILERNKDTMMGEVFSFADVAVSAFEANRFMITARRAGAVKGVKLDVRLTEKGETTLDLTARRTKLKGRDGILIWFDDITDQVKADRELRELNSRFIALLENTPDLIAIRGRDMRFQVVSQSFARFFGVSSWREMLGRTRSELNTEFAHQVSDERVKEVLDGGEFQASSEDKYVIDGQPMWIAARRVALRDVSGTVTGVLTIGRDITRRKLMEEEIEKALQVAHAERARAEAILAGAPDPIIIARDDSTIEYVNDQVQHTLGFERRDLIGKSIESLIPERFRTGHRGLVQNFFAASGPRIMGSGRELYALTADGREVPVEISLSPIKSSGAPVVIAVLRDITQQKLAEKWVCDARDAAEAATKAKSDFLASMSHEIRTPMNGITGMADLLAQTNLDDEQKHMVRTIRESGNSLITVINDILDFSKIEAGKMDFESVTMSIVDAVEGVASTLTPNATKKGVRIHVWADPKLPAAVYGDPTRLRQILFNLGGNAVKFSDGKDVQIRATPSERTDDKRVWVRFNVIDKGIGISKENQAKLFQAFSQAESSTTRRFGGTGLGLAICKRMTELLEGVIGIESEEGKGSTFWVELPFGVAENAKTNIKDRDLRGLKVLLVGSSEPRRSTIDGYLKFWGAEVEEADDAEAAVAALKRGNFSSVMLDLGLDQIQHEMAVGILRKALPTGSMPIIILQDFQHRGARIVDKDLVTVDANPLVRYRIITSVAVAAGRASPEIKTEDDALKVQRGKAPTIEEALAAGQLILLAEDNLTNQDVIRRQLGLLGYTCEVANNGAKALRPTKPAATPSC